MHFWARWCRGYSRPTVSELTWSRNRESDSRPLHCRIASACGSGQVVHSHALLSSSGIIWYRSKNREGNGTWKFVVHNTGRNCASPLLAQDLENGDEHIDMNINAPSPNVAELRASDDDCMLVYFCTYILELTQYCTIMHWTHHKLKLKFVTGVYRQLPRGGGSGRKGFPLNTPMCWQTASQRRCMVIGRYLTKCWRYEIRWLTV